MTIDDKTRDEDCDMILTEKLQKYRHYHLKKLIEQAKFTYSPLRRSIEKQTKTIGDKGIKIDALIVLKTDVQ